MKPVKLSSTGFALYPDEFFRGLIRQPEGDGEEVIMKKTGSRDAVVKHTLRAADNKNWDWVIELCKQQNEDTASTLAQWTSLEGELPPGTREEVPGLNPL